MTRIPDDELLSAYLDGELSAAERRDVERRLETDPAARRLLEQLRTVSGAVRALEPFRLGDDLSAAVLRQIEATRRETASDDPVVPLPAAARERGRRFLRPRALFWAAATVIVALVVSHYERSIQPLPQPVAKTQSAPTAPAATPEIGPMPRATELAGAPAKGGVRAQDVGQPAATAAGEPLLVKCCLLGPNAKRKFAALLASQQVYLEDLPARMANVLDRDRSQLPSKLAADGQVTARFAEVDAQRLAAVLAEMARHPEIYPVVVVSPAQLAQSSTAKQRVVFATQMVKAAK